MTRWRRLLDVATTIAVAVMAVVVIWNNLANRRTGAAERRPAFDERLIGKTVHLGSQPKGSPTAPVALVVFSDFECPYCKDFAQTTMPVLSEKYVDKGRLTIGFRHFPNERTHRNALYAAQTSACAGRQGKFWAMHDLFFSDRARLDPRSIDAYASTLTLDQDAFARCITDEASSLVDTDLSAAIALKLPASPAFVIGTRTTNQQVVTTAIIIGNRSVRSFESAIDAALAKAKRG